MKEPKLSIITINLNNAPGLRKTMESVVNQTAAL
jgi:glycosyltransferase involved in cell wall biosynthesis